MRSQTTTSIATGDRSAARHDAVSEVRTADGDRLFLVTIVTAVFVSVLTGSMVNVLLPRIREDLDVSPAQVSWVVTSYALVYAIGIPLYGRISDVFGIRRIYTIGLLAFAAGCLVSVVAPNLPMLVIGRIIQASGGAAVAALALVVVAREVPEERRGAAMGLVGASVGIGQAIGPMAGGFVGDLLGWRGLFLGPLVLMLVIIPFARRVLPGTPLTTERRFDLLGGGLFGLGTGGFLFGITQGQTAGFDQAVPQASFLIAATAIVGFVARIRATAHPFVSPRLFRNRAYRSLLIAGFLLMLANVSTLVLIPLIMVDVNDLSIREAGFVLTPGAIAIAVGSPYAGKVSDRIGVWRPMLVGLPLMTLALLFLSTVAAGGSPLATAAGILLLGAGFAMVGSPLNSAAAGTLPPEDMGAGMGIFSGTNFLGGGTGPALAGTLLAARQETNAGALNPFYDLDAAAYSDAFLVPIVAILGALVTIVALRARSGSSLSTRGERIAGGNGPAALAITLPDARRGKPLSSMDVTSIRASEEPRC